MSSTFGLYSRYYDLLYRDKDYAAEAAYIRALISEFHPEARDVLELGCGTGKHARLLAKSGLNVTGVDRSAEMIDAAQAEQAIVTIISGDARTVRLSQKFDVVLSLFHVVSYQATNDDVASMFETVATHLRDGGCFVFDVWYGPAVLRQLPQSRVKEMEDERFKVHRVAEPAVDFNQNWVDVNYSIHVTDKASGQVERFEECHRMRYFFTPEIDLFAKSSRMELIHGEQWLDRAVPSPETWGVTFILRKQS
jgi:SAM-dependent methyltransferase